MGVQFFHGHVVYGLNAIPGAVDHDSGVWYGLRGRKESEHVTCYCAEHWHVPWFGLLELTQIVSTLNLPIPHKAPAGEVGTVEIGSIDLFEL